MPIAGLVLVQLDRICGSKEKMLLGLPFLVQLGRVVGSPEACRLVSSGFFSFSLIVSLDPLKRSGVCVGLIFIIALMSPLLIMSASSANSLGRRCAIGLGLGIRSRNVS